MVGKRITGLALVVALALSGMSTVCADDLPGTTKDLLEKFSWAGGIEDTFIPQTKPGLRRLEEYELTQHYDQWKGDLDRAKSLGLTKLRWGVPWHKVEPRPGEYDWKWTDQVIGYMVDDLKIDPIIDLIHYGTPTWMTDGFLDPQYPQKVGSYAKAFAERYKNKVKYYTPTNEPAVTAEFCGLKGEWPPYLNGDAGYVKVLLPVTRGIQEISKAIRAADSDASLVAVEAMRYAEPADDNSDKAARSEFYRDMLPWDLVSGKVDDDHPLYDWLKKNGAEESTLKALHDNAVKQDVFGVNFYPWSIKLVNQDGKLESGPQRGRLLHKVLTNVYGYTKVPLFVTETSSTGDLTARSLWMSETIDAVRIARGEGIPVVGYTWFPMITMIDWQYRTNKKPLENYLLHLGLWDSAFDSDGVLQRKETALVDNYRDWIKLGMNPNVALKK
jgi:beta-glucosidase